MLLVRPIVLLILFGVFCISLTQSESHKNKAETLIKMKRLHKSDHNEFFDGKHYSSDTFSLYIKSFNVIPSNPIDNKTTPLLLIKFKFENHSMNNKNEIISWFECFQVEQGGKALDVADISTSVKTYPKRFSNSGTYDRSKGMVAYKLRNRKESVILKAYKINISKEISVTTLQMIK